MRARFHLSILAGGILALSVLPGCGSKPAPSPSHTSHGATKKVKGSVQSAGPGSAKNTLTRVGPYSAPPPVLPKGNQAAGAKLFSATCQSCHGPGGTGTGKAPRLAAPSSVVSVFQTEPALASFIQHNMPANNPGTLNATDAANAGAYVWRIAGGK